MTAIYVGAFADKVYRDTALSVPWVDAYGEVTFFPCDASRECYYAYQEDAGAAIVVFAPDEAMARWCLGQGGGVLRGHRGDPGTAVAGLARQRLTPARKETVDA